MRPNMISLEMSGTLNVNYLADLNCFCLLFDIYSSVRNILKWLHYVFVKLMATIDEHFVYDEYISCFQGETDCTWFYVSVFGLQVKSPRFGLVIIWL